MRLIIVGNPGNRRVALFAAAMVRAGLPRPEVISWSAVASGRPIEHLLGPDTLVRIESPGEDAEVDRLLRGADRPAERGEILGGRSWYAGFCLALDRVAEAAERTGARLLSDPAEIKIMFDKTACHRLLSRAGISVPPALSPGSPTSWEDLRSQMRTAGWRRVFVKPCHGSSASGVIALQVGRAGRILAITSVELAGRQLFNSLRIRRYQAEAEVATIVDALAPDGLHVERWFPKAAVDGRVADLRVVTVAGMPSHVVVRRGSSPMTNLHLGGARGDLSSVVSSAGDHYHAGLLTCREVAAQFPGSLHLGIDLMFGVDWRSHAIAEVNAFGDLLPGLLVEGRDSYDAQVAALRGALV